MTISSPATDGHSRTLPIALDAVGGDYAPREIILGALEAYRASGIPLTLVGPVGLLREELTRLKIDNPPFELINADDIIAMDEAPAHAVRQKRGSSIVVGTMLVKEGRAAGFVSAGNSGAVMAAAVLYLGRIAGVDRPALATVFPTTAGQCLILDVGAATECKTDNLVQFALMGNIYYQQVMNKPSPRIGLLSNGEESSKGTPVVQATHRRLASSKLNFIGNIEGKDIPFDKADVIVTDGFAGNVALKMAEGIAEFTFTILKSEVEKSGMLAQIGAMLLMPTLRRIKKRFDYDEYGAALLLGVNGVSLVAHGRSRAKAIKNALLQAQRLASVRVVDLIRSDCEQLLSTSG